MARRTRRARSARTRRGRDEHEVAAAPGAAAEQRAAAALFEEPRLAADVARAEQRLDGRVFDLVASKDGARRREGGHGLAAGPGRPLRPRVRLDRFARLRGRSVLKSAGGRFHLAPSVSISARGGDGTRFNSRRFSSMPSNVNPIGQCLGGSFGQQAKLENVSVQTLEGMKQIFTAERKGLDATPPPLGRLPAWQMCNAPDGKWGATEVGSPPGDWDVNAYWTKVRAICFSFFQEMRAFLFVAASISNIARPRRTLQKIEQRAESRARSPAASPTRRAAARDAERNVAALAAAERRRSFSTASSGNRRRGSGRSSATRVRRSGPCRRRCGDYQSGARRRRRRDRRACGTSAGRTPTMTRRVAPARRARSPRALCETRARRAPLARRCARACIAC